MRLSLFRNFRKKVKNASTCRCFNQKAIDRLKRMNNNERETKKAWRHRANCYLSQGNINNDFKQLLAKSVFEMLQEEKDEQPPWY